MADKNMGPSLLRHDTYTTTAAGSVFESQLPMKYFSLQVAGDPVAATGWSVDLEGSLDGINFDAIITHATGTGDGKIYFSGNQVFPARYIRSRVTSLTLGAADKIVAHIMGVA